MLIDAMTAAMVLSVLVIGLGAFWIKGDSIANGVVQRQKAIFVASSELERLTALYKFTSFGTGGPTVTTGYNGPASFPTSRLTYGSSLSLYVSGGTDYTTTSVTTFQNGPGNPFLVWVGSSILPSLNRSYVWVDQAHKVLGRLSWVATNITPSQCTVGGDGCPCLNYLGLLSGHCQRIDLYLEYPYRLVSGAAVAGSTVESVTLSTVVGRST